jgi:hypothetical protein
VEAQRALSGADASGDDTLGKTADALVTTILGLDDADQEGDLLGPFRSLYNVVLAGNVLPRLFTQVLRALSNHVGGLNAWCQANDVRVHYLLGEVASWLNAANLFPPVVDPICSFAVTGATTGTFTEGTAIDTDEYGKANMVIEVTSSAITTETTATLTMVKLDGTTEDKVVVLANTLVLGNEVDIGTHGTDMYVNCTAIAITGGTGTDAFKVKSELERAVAL